MFYANNRKWTMMTNKTELLLILAVVILLLHHVASKECPNLWWKCGDSFCCCKGNKSAMCLNQNLSYIPKLPKGIKSLTFKGNNIKALSPETFDNVSISSIEFLGLLSNGIENVDYQTFAKFTNLQELSLQNNERIKWSQLKAALYSIRKNITHLYLDGTGLSSLPDDIFDGLKGKNVKMLTLRNNTIKLFNEKSFFHLQTLKVLDMQFNWIRDISMTRNGTRLGHRSIEKLSLAYNEFAYWPPWFCGANATNKTLYPRLKSLDLTGNFIMVIVKEAWSCLKSLTKLNLQGNVIQTLRNDAFLDLKSLAILHVSYMAKPLQKIESKAFHSPSLQELHFNNNNINFKPESDIAYDKLFTFCPNLTRLLLGYNHLRAIYDTKLVAMLSPLKQLTELHLDGAHLYKIPENLLNKFTNLTKLYMGGNKIEFITPEAFLNVSKLTVLHLEANKIKVINETFPVALRNSLTEVNLASNPFSCSFCAANNNTWFRYWAETPTIRFLHWPSFYKCASPPSEHGTYLASHKPTAKDCEVKDPMIIAYITIGVFLVVSVLIGVAGYRGRWYIRYWTIKVQRKLAFRNQDDPERQKLIGDESIYDAYVIYQENDRGFVRGEILPFMETENNYKLFIWDRDFTAGDQTVGIVVDNMYKSNHVIAVVSKNFLKDPWCDFQLAVSLDRQIELKRHFLTLVTLDDLDKKLLNKTWCVLLTKMTTAEWCERRNDIRRKLFEDTILTNVPCTLASRMPRRLAGSVNADIGE